MPKLIFILEDNDDLRELYELILAEENYEILSFSTVAEFREHATEVPELFLLDVMLPDGNGIDLCKELIMVSAHKDVKDIKAECPRADFIPKPFDIDHSPKDRIEYQKGHMITKQIWAPL